MQNIIWYLGRVTAIRGVATHSEAAMWQKMVYKKAVWTFTPVVFMRAAHVTHLSAYMHVYAWAQPRGWGVYAATRNFEIATQSDVST